MVITFGLLVLCILHRHFVVRLVGPHLESARMKILRQAERLGIQDRVEFLGVVDDETLDYLYRNACVVGLISASEGFGFPVLEALARGVPVVVAKGTGAAEIGGDAVIAVDPTSGEEITEALRRAAEPDFRHQIATRGPARALHFSAERTARGYVEVFRRAAGR